MPITTGIIFYKIILIGNPPNVNWKIFVYYIMRETIYDMYMYGTSYGTYVALHICERQPLHQNICIFNMSLIPPLSTEINT